MLEGLDKESRAFREEALRLTWWMRGGLDYEQAMALTLEERKIVDQIIKDNMDTTKKSGLPFF